MIQGINTIYRLHTSDTLMVCARSATNLFLNNRYMKKTLALLSILAFVLVAIPHADARVTATSINKDGAAATCIKAAVATREASLGTGITAYGTAVSTAYTTRATALAAAYEKSTAKEIDAAIKDAWKTFKTDLKTARADWKKTSKSAWTTYKSDRKKCRGADIPDIPVDTSNQGAELK